MKRTGWLLCGMIFLGCSLLPAAARSADEDSGDELVDLVIGLVSDADKDVRALGFDQVRAEAKGEAATIKFAALLPQLPPDAQVGLLSALTDRADSAARPAVAELLAASREEPVRVAAINALGFLGDAADAESLLQLLTKGSAAEIEGARASLVRLRGDAVPATIAAAMKQAPTPLRITMIEILASRRAFAALPDLVSAAVDADPAVRTAAMVALGQLAGPEQIPGMVQGVLKAEKGREREAAEKAVMLVCSRIEDPQTRAEPLVAAMNKLPAADRTTLLSTLGRIGGPSATKMIEAAIADSNSAMHDTGIRALCNWPDVSLVPRLIELTGKDPHPEHRTMTLRALIRIAPLRDARSDAQRLTLLQQALTLCARDAERNLVLQRARAIRTPETLRFVLPYTDQPAFAQQACETVVELAHDRQLRDANKAEFHSALDKVIATSKDATVIDRANRYKQGQTWVRPAGPQQP